MIALVKTLVRADRKGDWELHMKTVESLITVFHKFNCINYLRYGCWYLERVKMLEVKKPYFYRKFIQRHFVVKHRGKVQCCGSRYETGTDDPEITEKLQGNCWSDK